MIVFIHGLMGSPSNWNEVISLLESSKFDYKSYTIDYLHNDYMNRFYKEHFNLKKHMKSIGVGNSIGCKLLLENINDYDKVILVAPPYKFQQKSAFTSQSRLEELKQELFYNYENIDKHEIDKTISYWTGKTRDKVILKRLKVLKQELLAFNFINYYQKYQDKIHFVLGRHDKITILDEFLLDAKKYYPRAKITIMENSSHVPQMENPTELCHIIKSEYGAI